MGGRAWSDDHYADAATARAKAGVDTFDYHKKTAAAPVSARKAHPSLDPMGLKFRESRDSDVHPTTLPIIVTLDQTGSMAKVPGIVQEALPELMGLLIRQGWAAHPAILISAIGDVRNGEKVPLQFGQFESDIAIETDLTNLFMEGQGGGNRGESYDLAMWAAAKHTVTDAWEKRAQKGYMFIIGDEPHFDPIMADDIEKVFGYRPQADMSMADLYAELREKWELFYVMPNMTNHWNDASVLNQWRNLIGQNVLLLEEPTAICQLIAATIGAHYAGIDDAGIVSGLGALAGGKATDLTVAGAITTAISGITRGSRGTEIKVNSSGEPSGLTPV